MGAWGVGMQANDTALDAIGINEKKPAKVLEEGIDQFIKEEDYLGILGLADRALDLKQVISDKTKKKVMVIPLEERIRALKIIYPNRPDCWSGSAGNIDEHSMSMGASEWDKFLNEAPQV